MENNSEFLKRKKANILDSVRKISSLDSTSSSLKTKKIKLRNEVSSLMKLNDNISPKKLDFPICFSLLTHDQKKANIDIKKKEKKKNEINLNLKSIRPKHLNNLNLNDFIKSNNKKIVSRNINQINSLSPINSKKISSISLFSPSKNNNHSLILNKNYSQINLLPQKNPIIINQIGLSSPLVKLNNTKFSNSNSTIEQDISFIKNIKGLGIKSLNYNINLSDKKIMPSIFSSPINSEYVQKGKIEKKNKKNKIFQMKKKMQKDINNMENILDKGKINIYSKDENKEINKNDIKDSKKSEIKILENKKPDKNKDIIENENYKIKIFSNKIKSMSNTFYKDSNVSNNQKNMELGKDLRFSSKLPTNIYSNKTILSKLENKFKNYLFNKSKSIVNLNKLEGNQNHDNKSNIIETQNENEHTENIHDNKEKMARLSRLKKSSLKSGIKTKNKVNFNNIKDRNEITPINRKQTDCLLKFNFQSNRSMILEDDKDNNFKELVKRTKSTKLLDSSKINILSKKKNKFYLILCKKKIINVYENNKFLKKKYENLNEIMPNNRIYRKICIKKTKMLLNAKESVSKIINKEKSYLNIPQQQNEFKEKVKNFYDELLINYRLKKRDEHKINKFIINNNFNCKICSCLFKSIILPIEFDGLPNNITSKNSKKKTFIIERNKRRRITRKNFHSIKLFKPAVEKESENLEKFSITKTKNTFIDELEWIYSPINLLSVQNIILRSNNYYYEKNNNNRYGKKRKTTTLRRLNHSFVHFQKDENQFVEKKFIKKLSTKFSGFNFAKLKNYKKSDFSLLYQKKFFKRQRKRVKSINLENQKGLKTSFLNNSSSSEEESDRLSNLDNDKNLENIYLQLMTFIIEGKNKQFMEQFEKYKNVIDINQQLIEGNTLLIICAREGNFAIAKFLCEKGIKVNFQNNNGNTALHYAIGNQFYSIVDILTRHGAREDISNNKGLLAWDCIENNLE